MSKLIALALFLVFTIFAHAQVEPPKQTQVSHLLDLGEIVENVVIAKVTMGFNEQELVVAKFGKKLTAGTNTTVTKTEMKAEKRTRKVMVNGQEKEQEYTVYIPISTVVALNKRNVTLTEDQRSIGVSKIDAFDLLGKPIEREVWTKMLQEPKHVLLIREPISDAAKLDPFYAGLLKEDTLLLFIKSDQPPANPSNSEK